VRLRSSLDPVLIRMVEEISASARKSGGGCSTTTAADGSKRSVARTRHAFSPCKNHRLSGKVQTFDVYPVE